MSPHPLRAGLAGLLDYAGLFPPASLDLASVLERFGRYAGSTEEWMLGRLILPAGQLAGAEAFARTCTAPLRPAWTISVLVPVDGPIDRAGDMAAAFNAAHDAMGMAVVAVELAAATTADVERAGRVVPEWLERYVELPIDAELPARLDAVSRAGCYAKFRTGGVTADRFPDPAALAGALCECAAREVPLKLTAGLHHPLRNQYPLTYEPGSTSARMHGFVNVVLAAGLAARDPGTDRAVMAALLEEARPASFTLDDDTISWRGATLTADELSHARTHLLRSVGSCSFEEPVADLRDLGWLPHP